jgi:MFS family permease
MKIFEKDEIKILWPFYLEAFVGTALWILTPFMVLYFSSINLSSFQIGILLAIWPLASLLFEIPTGAIADLYGRKFSVLFGWLMQGILLVLIILSNNFYYLCLILFLSGIFQTFISGALDAWTVDLLKNKKKENLVKHFFAKKQSFCNLAFIISGLLGVFAVGKFGIKSVWILSAGSLFISVLFLWFGEDDHVRKKQTIKKSFIELKNQTKKSIAYSYNHPVLFYLLLISFIATASFTLQGFISWTPILKNLGFPDVGFGYLWSLTAILGIFTPLLAIKILKTKPEKNILLFSLILFIIQAALMVFANTLFWLIGLIILFYGIIDFESPIASTFFHKHAPSKLRATIGSINSMIMSISAIIFMPLAGFLIEKIGPKYTILISGILLIPNIILYLMIKETKSLGEKIHRK